MELREYLFRRYISITKFAKQLEITRTYMSRIVHKTEKPSKRLAKDIERATFGEVTLQEILGEIPLEAANKVDDRISLAENKDCQVI